MKKVRITAVRQTVYHELTAKYENPIEHTCDIKAGVWHRGRWCIDGG